jgi:serine protease Do
MRFIHCLILGTLLACGAPLTARAQDDGDLRHAIALQKVMQRNIQQNEASIACILVSRSEFHPRDPQYPGKLGVYEPYKLHLPDMSEIDRDKWRKKLDLADRNTIPAAFGSGVVVEADGLILTNYHVVQDAAKIYVRLPGGKGSYADIHAADPRSDLAVLRLIQPVGALKAITFGDADKLERGQFILTLTNPFAVGFRDGQPSASYGILSNIRRRGWLNVKEEDFTKPFHFYGTLLQTDARTNLGCSGGALLNLQGEMVGLMTSMAGIQGGETPGGFAVPITPGIRRVIDGLKRGDEIDYGFLGINFDEKHAAGQTHIQLTTIGPGSPADGKLKEGDVLLSVNGQPLTQREDIFLTIGMHLAGSNVRMLVRRAGKERAFDVTLAKLYVPGKRIASTAVTRPYFRGLRVDHTSLLIQQEPRRQFIPSGVLVSEVQTNSPAERAKLKVGDVITHVNAQRVTTPAAFYQAINEARLPVEMTLYALPNEIPPRVQLK